MNCLHCELKRAKMLAGVLAFALWPVHRIAEHLSKTFGETYYVDDGSIYRNAKMPPHKPHLIREKT